MVTSQRWPPCFTVLILLVLSLLVHTTTAWILFPSTSSANAHKQQKFSRRRLTLFAPSNPPENPPADTTTTRKNRPNVTGVTLKVAFDKHWGVAEMADNAPRERFTCSESLDMVHRLRRDSDAVLVGRGTVDQDDCSLTVRRGIPIEQQQLIKQPLRVVLDPRLSLVFTQLNEGTQYKILNDGLPTVIYHCVADVDLASLCISEHVSLVYTPTPEEFPRLPALTNQENRSGMYMSPKFVLEHLETHYQTKHVMLEGGPATAKNFLHEGLVDRAIIVQAPIEFVEPVPSGMTEETFVQAGLEKVGTRASGVDIIDYWARKGKSWPGGSVKDWP